MHLATRVWKLSISTQVIIAKAFEDYNHFRIYSALGYLTPDEFMEATELIRYEEVPYEKYWDYYINLYTSNGQKITPEISQRIHTVRLYASNHCPEKCKFCSSTWFLPDAIAKKSVAMVNVQGEHLVALLKRIIKAHPRVETFYFTDDNFCINRRKLKDFNNPFCNYFNLFQ